MPARSGPAYRIRAAGLSALVAGVVLALLAIAALGLDTVSAVRAYVAGEGRWSKAQQEAVYWLVRFAETGEPELFERYEAVIAVPLGDRVAREQLQLEEPDAELVRHGLIQGDNHPDDVDRMARFFRRFRQVSYMDSAVTLWATGDSLIAELRTHAQALRTAVAAGDSAAVPGLVGAIERLDRQLRPLEYAFSDILGEGARWAGRLVVRVLVAAGLVLILAATAVVVLLLRQLERSEQALRASEERYRTLVNDAAYGIGRSAADGTVLAANPALVQLLGYASEADVLQLNLARDVYLRPGDRAQVVSRFTRPSDPLADPVNVGLKRKDGTIVTVRVSGRVREAADGSVDGYDVVAEDVTERLALEERVHQSEKMEAVGRLSGGLAHDLNSLLTAIMANADLVAAALGPHQGEALADAQEIREAAYRSGQLIRKLLAFSRREELQPEPVALDALVRETVPQLRSVLPEHVAIRTEAEPGLPRVEADHGAVEQILVNLATNARDAMPHGGVLSLSLRRVRDENHLQRTRDGNVPPAVCVEVRDTGTGMTPETLGHAFEPFFTTKPVGAGTGLGLAMVYGLMKQHGGWVELASTPDAGTTVRLYFPARAGGDGEEQDTSLVTPVRVRIPSAPPTPCVL